MRLELGNLSRVEWIGTIGEYRVDWGPDYRIYLGKHGDRFVSSRRWRHEAAPVD